MDELEDSLRRHAPYADGQEQHRQSQREGVLEAFSRERSVESRGKNHTPSIDWRSVMRHPAFGMSAASFVFLGAAIAWSLLAGTSPSAFAQLIEPLMNSKSGSFSAVVRLKEKELSRETSYFNGPLVRMNVTKRGKSLTQITDTSKQITLDIDHTNKRATLMWMLGSGQEGFDEDQKLIAKYGGGLLGFIRAMLDPADEPKEGTARKEIRRELPGGVVMKGLEISGPETSLEAWADPATGEPAELIMRANAWPPGMETVLTDFEFDVEPDPGLFSMKPPEGYEFVDRTQSIPGP